MTVSKSRSTDPEDYQDLPQAIGAMSKNFADGFVIPLHEHERDQLLYASSGIMRLRTAGEAWIVPRDSAVYIPAETQHSVDMHGAVDMRTLYIDTAGFRRATASPARRSRFHSIARIDHGLERRTGSLRSGQPR